MQKRGTGILFHITSLPSPYGIGDLGASAYSFADFLYETHQKYWQILPLNITSPAYGNSPYSSFSAFAGNPLLISPDQMVNHGFLERSDLEGAPAFEGKRVDYGEASAFKIKLLNKSFDRNKDRLMKHQEFQNFCSENSFWLRDFSLFISIKNRFDGMQWSDWPERLRDREKDAISDIEEELGNEILREKFLQYLFFTQWFSVKNYCDSKNIRIIGDIPIYVNYDSADVWSNPGIFSLDDKKKPEFVAGVPPDYFSSTGQLWGHPVYKWDVIKKNGYSWWINRIDHNMKLFHMFRLDHFRGFIGYWQVHSSEKTAINGKWVEAPAEDFFSLLMKRFPDLSIIAEDLGIITPDVKAIIDQLGFPGMKVLLFAFGEDLPTNPYAPHNHIKNCVVYTGTHDNNTIKGWFKKELNNGDRTRISEYIGREITEKNVHWEIIRLALMSVADIVIIPMQDILGLGEEDRMNHPGTASGNWEWRLVPEQLSPSLKKKLHEMTVIYGRDHVNE